MMNFFLHVEVLLLPLEGKKLHFGLNLDFEKNSRVIDVGQTLTMKFFLHSEILLLIREGKILDFGLN